MKKSEDLVIPAQPEKTVKREFLVCDICNIERKQLKACSQCGREVCIPWWLFNKAPEIQCGDVDPEEPGDYPAYYCRFCFNLKFRVYREERMKLRDDYDDAVEKIEIRIREESLKSKK